MQHTLLQQIFILEIPVTFRFIDNNSYHWGVGGEKGDVGNNMHDEIGAAARCGLSNL